MYKGVIPVLHAPFFDNGELDFNSLRREVDIVIEDGACAMMLFGYATEFLYLSKAERDAMVEAAVQSARGRVPVIASVTELDAADVGETAALFERLGADAVMLLPRKKEGAFFDYKKYFSKAAEGTLLPLFLQYAPHMTGVTLTADEIVKISCGRLTGVKSEVGFDFITELINASQGGISVYVGNQGAGMVDALALGAAGVMPGSSRVYTYKKIYDAFFSGGGKEAAALYEKFAPYLNLFHNRYEMYFEKKVLAERGIFTTAFCRMQIEKPDAEAEVAFEKAQKSVGF
ncbi:MAG: dihydrodipicolinate synthase family protein [Defluviitaleaceae bacterium]|nr:dihydrodipicolinate synthase family protein [Defluviitaleaceae bacterium]